MKNRIIGRNKNVLGRVRNCMGEQALHCEMVASSYVHQPYHSHADFMFHLHSDPTHAIVVAGMQHCVCCAVTPPLHNISTILTYRSYVLFLIHSW